MANHQYDVLVLGSGPAGESAAICGAKAGKKVAIVERAHKIGGSCAHQGTIPSKSLRHTVKQVMRFNSNPLFHKDREPQNIRYPDVLSHSMAVIDKQNYLHSKYIARNRIKLHSGDARFIDEHTVQVILVDGAVDIISADHIVIATGSRPYNPKDVDFTHPRVYDSDSILEMCHHPQTLIIYGAGVIGCEYASIFAGLTTRVDLINSRNHLLSFLDTEISDALSYHLRDRGVLVRHNEEYEKVEADERGVTLYLKSGKRIRGDALLWCNGRTGNTDDLNVEAAGLEADHRGQLSVNERYQSAVPHIYAAGDVVGWPSLASASFDQGRAAMMAILGEDKDFRFVRETPTGIYTLPEISSLGLTELELTEQKVPYEVARAFFKNTARAQISGEDVGVLKLLFHVETLEILGIHCFGAEASEIIHIGQVVMKQKGEANTLRYFLDNTFNYPTMAEAYRIAALDGLNRIRKL